ncbi:hypothetical protein [Chelatococcus reniformis]|uniref:Uncharacterized protein n=1 Tax=Chelatococcus reniformis TaxID=1494448 RepID=A0A916XNN5_9HYPH|nr:hypothetical protein [Chelatococcus reniformis]GGC90335.1 hypothetical protein GCM10010994_55210 [Chelatococcus reniformis]
MQIGLAYRCWPLSVSPDMLSPDLRAMIVLRTNALLARVRSAEDDDG